MERRYRLKAGETPESIAALGNGDKRDLEGANKWMTGFKPWNPGQQMTIPMGWNPIPDEYPSA